MKKICYTFLLSFLIQQFGFSQEGWFWQNPLPQGNDLNSVCFIDANVGFTVGNSGTILKTTNGGQSWSSQWIASSIHLYDVSFFDENNGIVVGLSLIHI